VPAAIELDARGRRLRAALGFLQLPATEPELHLLHRWLDTWNGIGLIAVGVERQGLRLGRGPLAGDLLRGRDWPALLDWIARPR
jgi:hypothetical protein